MKKRLTSLLALCIALPLAACGGGATSGSEPKTTGPASAVESTAAAVNPAAEQVFHLASVAKDLADKIENPWENPTLIPGLMFRTLFLAESDLSHLKDDLAKADYTVSPDGLNYSIEFIGGKWSDGAELTPQDVAFSIKTNLKAAVSNGIFTTAFNKIVGAAEWKDGSATDLRGLKIEGKRLNFELSTPFNAFAPVLAQFAILPEHILRDVNPLELHNDRFWQKPVCSGMFRLDEFNVGNYYTLVPNEQYSVKKPKIQKVINTFVADYITAAQNNQTYYYNSNSPEVIGELNKLKTMTMYPVDILFYRYFICNMKGVDGKENPVMQDERVRQAILYAIDREKVAESLFPELAHSLNSGVPDDSSAYNGVEFAYNPEKAKQLLKEAGYDFNYKFRILYYYKDQTSVDFMEAIAYYLGEIGMQVELTQSAQGTQDLFKTRNYDIGYKGLSAFNISEWYNEYASSNANFQNIFGGDKAFDAQISALAAATTTEQSNQALAALQTVEQEKLYKIPLYTIGNNIFVNTSHVKLPEGIKFGNPWYRCDIGFENWEIIR